MFKKIDIKDQNNSFIIEISKDKDLDLTNINIDKSNNELNRVSSGEIVLSTGSSFNNNLEIVSDRNREVVNNSLQNNYSNSDRNRSSDSVSSSFIDKLFKTVKNKTSRKIILGIVLVVIVVEEFVSLIK